MFSKGGGLSVVVVKYSMVVIEMKPVNSGLTVLGVLGINRFGIIEAKTLQTSLVYFVGGIALKDR